MRTTTRWTALVLLLLAAAAAAVADTRPSFLGACYCRVAGMLRCTGDLREPDCRRQCNEALCDEWFWKERLPCWNWGYGG